MKILDRLWGAISEGLFGDFGPPGVSEEGARQRAQATAPVVWLLGKTGAGKTAIVAALTGDPRAVVGAGFEPCTRRPLLRRAAEVPLLRFLDTRGLGEADYDPANDIAWCEEQSHLLAGRDAGRRIRRKSACCGSCAGAPPPSRLADGGRADRPASPLSGRRRASADPYPFTGGPEDMTQSDAAACADGRRWRISVNCFDGLRGPRPASCRSISPLPEDGFRRTTLGSSRCGSVLEAPGPMRLRGAASGAHRRRERPDTRERAAR